MRDVDQIQLIDLDPKVWYIYSLGRLICCMADVSLPASGGARKPASWFWEARPCATLLRWMRQVRLILSSLSLCTPRETDVVYFFCVVIAVTGISSQTLRWGHIGEVRYINDAVRSWRSLRIRLRSRSGLRGLGGRIGDLRARWWSSVRVRVEDCYMEVLSEFGEGLLVDMIFISFSSPGSLLSTGLAGTQHRGCAWNYRCSTNYTF